MIHKVAFVVIAAAAKGVVVAGHALGHALAANPEVVAGKAVAVPLAHAAAAHPVAAALAGTAIATMPIVTIAYLDIAEANKQLAAKGVTSARTVKISVAGNFVNGEFSTITGPFRQNADHVMLSRYDEETKSLTQSVVIKAAKVESRIAAALAGGNVVVLA